MKNITTQIVKVNGQFDIYANQSTKRAQNYSDLAEKKGRNWSEMSKRSRANFRKKNQNNIHEVAANIEIFNVSAEIPLIFSEFQLKEAIINHLIHPSSGTLFLKCKNGKTGYSTSNFKVN